MNEEVISRQHGERTNKGIYRIARNSLKNEEKGWE